MKIQLGTKHVRIIGRQLVSCTKFGTNLLYLSYIYLPSKADQNYCTMYQKMTEVYVFLKVHSPYCVSSPCNNQMKTVVINHRTMLIIVQACAFNCAPCGVEWSQYHQNKWIQFKKNTNSNRKKNINLKPSLKFNS